MGVFSNIHKQFLPGCKPEDRFFHDKPHLFFHSTDEPDSGVALRVSPPRTSPRHDPIIQLPLDEDDYLQPKSSNPKAYLELENNRGKRETGFYCMPDYKNL